MLMERGIDHSTVQVRKLSELCSQRLASLSNTKAGGWEIARDHLRTLTAGRCHFSADLMSNPRAYTGSTLHAGAIDIQYFRYNWPTECETWTKRGQGEHLVIHIPLVGSFTASQSSQSVEVGPGSILIVGSPGDIRRRWRGECEILNVVISHEALNRLATVEFGLNDNEPIRFGPLGTMSFDEVPTFLSFVETLICDLSSRRPIFTDPLVSAQADATMMHIVLKSLPHSHRETMEGRRRRIAPFYVRRAEDYISQHLHEDLTIEDLAKAAGVSLRTIFYGFKQYRHLTPMKYVRWLRLREARRELLRARNKPCKVSEIAGNWGYASASHFSRDYKSLYGESPQMTIRRPTAANDPSPADWAAGTGWAEPA